MRGAIQKWVRSEDDANRKLVGGSDASTRFAGLRKSEKNQAVWLLIAIMPAIVLSFLLPIWSESGTAERAIWVISIIWAVIVLAGGFALMVRSALRAMRNENG